MTVSLATNALTELATLKAELGISVSTYDDYLNRTINVISDLIEAYCDRKFYWEEDIAEKRSGHGTVLMPLDRTPISSITSITYNGSTVSSDNYEVHDASAGILYSLVGWEWTAGASGTITTDPIPGTERKLYTVTYDGGYVTPAQATADVTLTRNLPWDLEDACIQLCVARYRSQGSDPNVKSEKLLSWSATYGDDTGMGIPSQVKTILDKYVRCEGA